MSKPVNTVAIGAFVTGALLLLFVVAFYIGGNAFRGDIAQGVLVFDGSVKGLNVGAPVAFKGVKIGEVTRVDLIVDTDTYEVVTPVRIRVDVDKIKRRGHERDSESMRLQALIDRGLRAQLQMQSLLTGLLYVQLDFHPETEPRFTAEEIGADEDVFVIPTIPTDLELLTRKLDSIDFAALVDSLANTIKGVDNFINNPQMQAISENHNNTLGAVEQLSGGLKTEVDALAPELRQLIANTDATVQEINRKLPALTESAQAGLDELAATLTTARAALDNMEYLLSDDSAALYDVRQAAQELSAAGRALQSLAETLETQPEALIKGKSPEGN
jgi:paraquat-inducible protein B